MAMEQRAPTLATPTDDPCIAYITYITGVYIGQKVNYLTAQNCRDHFSYPTSITG
jgi:hypothetical protein